MNKSEILAFLNAHPACHVATVVGVSPRARGLQMHKADESGILFQTWTLKDIYGEVVKNPEAELCFNDYEKGIQIRVNGKFEIVDDLAVKKEVMDARPSLKGFLDKLGYEKVAIFRMKNGKASVWTRAVNFDPKTYIDL
ncbi:pyridoxamine 5'-phosphate oxidase family protein [Chloroflexota bacterium]